MQRVVIIGTLHLGLTPLNELKSTLETLKPNQVLVELPQNIEDKIKTESSSNEMVFAANWAQINNIPVGCFDVDEGNTLKDGISENNEDYLDLVKQQVSEIKAFSWKELNNDRLWREGRLGKIERKLYTDCVDNKKDEAREERMLENIKRLMLPNGTIVILTGIGHLNFFEKNLPDSEILFRK